MRQAQDRVLLLLVIAAGTASCDGPQSAFVSAGRDAEQINQLFAVMSVGALIVWVVVVGLAVYAIRTHSTHTHRAANLFIIGGGVALPAVVLGALLAYGLPMLPSILKLPSDDGLRIHVTGKQWWWRVEYITPAGVIETANEVRLPVGRRVELQLESRDVIHAFWVPSIAGKMDMIPGRVTRLALEPTRTGIFRGTCAEYCGASHAKMAFEAVVMEPAAFAAWLEAQSRPAQPAIDPVTARGQAAFTTHGCSACHTVRGIAAAGRIGPDLTHVGSRLRLAAGTLPNDPDAFAAWITQTAALKPGAHMPAFRGLAPEELSALAAFLENLQ